MNRVAFLVLVAGAISCVGVYLHGTSRDVVLDRFHALFYNSQTTWAKNDWLGITTLQNPNDVWITQEIIAEVRPDFIIETGTWHGGSAILWAMLLEQVNPDGRVITIDIDDNTAAAREFPIFPARVDFFHGSSTDPQIVEEIVRRVQGKTVLVILDSDHREGHVRRELELYAPLVSLGSYLIVQDTNVNGHPIRVDFGPGPMEALDDFLQSQESFEIDASRERLLFTLHPRGYLKRVR